MTGSLEDKFAIQELIARYSHSIDSGAYDAWIECFAEDGVFEGSRMGRFVGHAELRRFTEQFKTRRAEWPNVRHCVMNTMTNVDGDTATSSSYLQVLLTGREGTRFMFAGRYHDTFVRVAGEWRFKERKVVRDEVPA